MKSEDDVINPDVLDLQEVFDRLRQGLKNRRHDGWRCFFETSKDHAGEIYIYYLQKPDSSFQELNFGTIGNCQEPSLKKSASENVCLVGDLEFLEYFLAFVFQKLTKISAQEEIRPNRLFDWSPRYSCQ